MESPPGEVQPRHDPLPPLRSWQEIADFLRVSPATVRRWEELEGLPVRRITESGGIRVLAGRDELLFWRAQRQNLANDSVAPLKLPSEDDILETWAQIAHYLNTTERTARRWEAEIGLPVRRHKHLKLDSVYASAAELDAWMQARGRPPQPSAEAAPLDTAKDRHGLLGLKSLLSLAILLLSLVAFAGYRVYQTGPAVPQFHSVQVTLPAGIKEHSSLSPDGKQVVFAWNENDPAKRRIFIASRDGSGLRRLTGTQHSDTFPRWSPDGRHVAFGRVDYMGRVHIILIASDGSGPEREIADIQSDAPYLSWTGDGRSLLVVDRGVGGVFSLFLVDVASSRRTALTHPPPGYLGDLHGEVSAGGQVAIVRYRTANDADVYLMSIRGGEPERLTFEQCRIRGLAWMPDGNGVVFSADRGERQFRLWYVGKNGHPVSPVGDTTADAIFPNISPAGGRPLLTYVRRERDHHIRRYRVGQDLDSKPVIASAGWNGQPAPSPDGSRIAFVSDREGYPNVYVAEKDGGNARPVTNFRGAAVRAPAWSPRGDRLAFVVQSQGHQGLYVMTLSAGVWARLTWKTFEYGHPTWSRDGEWIYFRSLESGVPQIWKIPADGDEAIQVTRQGGFEAMESMNGKELYFIKEGGPVPVTEPLTALYRMPVEGGEEVNTGIRVRAGYWAVTNKGILILHLWERDDVTYMRLHPLGATPRLFLSIPARSDRLEAIATTPDAASVYWSQLEHNVSELMIGRR
jgi:Tol biopolymer transport system component